MPTFREFLNVAEMTVKDNTSPKRMEEILSIMRKYHVAQGLTPEKAVSILEALGPTYVKIGQMASSRSDILPAEYCKAFEKLQANVSPMSFQTVLDCLDEAYGASWKSVFASIEEKPLGSASIAQVHKATLLDGSVVAVKVRRPGIVKQMAEDITMMKHLLAWAEFVVPSQEGMMLNLQSFVDELERTTENEVDFSIELNKLVRFHKEIEKQPGISSPLPYPDASRDSVLVMEYVEGIEVDDLAQKVKREDKGYAQADESTSRNVSFRFDQDIPVGLDASFEAGEGLSIGVKPTDHVHVTTEASVGDGVSVSVKPRGDVSLHRTSSASAGEVASSYAAPNNASQSVPDDSQENQEAVDYSSIDMEAIAQRLVQSYVTQVLDEGFFHADPHPGNIVIRGEEIVWIDLGMVGTLSASQRALVSQMFHAVTSNNAYELKEAVLALSTVHGQVNQGELLRQMTMLLQKYGSADLSDINIGTMFEEIIEVMRKQNLVVQPSVTTLARGVVTIEGVLAEIAPNTNVLQTVSDHVLKQEMSTSSIEGHLLNMAAASAESAEAMARLPRQVSDSIDMLTRGEISIIGDMKVPENALMTLYAIAGRLSLAIISVGLFLGSSILCTTSLEPQFLGVPILGVFGFIGAFVLSVYVIVRTIQSRHEMRNNLKLK